MSSQRGWVKRTSTAEYRVQARAGQGIAAFRRTEKTGPLVALRFVDERQELMIGTSLGRTLRLSANDIPEKPQRSQGEPVEGVDKTEEVAGLEAVPNVRL